MRRDPIRPLAHRAFALAALALAAAPAAAAQDGVTRGEPITLVRVDQPFAIDGRLDEPGWQQATAVDSWLETKPGDKQPAKVANAGARSRGETAAAAGS